MRAIAAPSDMSERMRLARSIADELALWGRAEERAAVMRVYADAAAMSADPVFLAEETRGLLDAGDPEGTAVVVARRLAVLGDAVSAADLCGFIACSPTQA